MVRAVAAHKGGLGNEGKKFDPVAFLLLNVTWEMERFKSRKRLTEVPVMWVSSVSSEDPGLGKSLLNPPPEPNCQFLSPATVDGI